MGTDREITMHKLGLVLTALHVFLAAADSASLLQLQLQLESGAGARMAVDPTQTSWDALLQQLSSRFGVISPQLLQHQGQLCSSFQDIADGDELFLLESDPALESLLDQGVKHFQQQQLLAAADSFEKGSQKCRSLGRQKQIGRLLGGTYGRIGESLEKRLEFRKAAEAYARAEGTAPGKGWAVKHGNVLGRLAEVTQELSEAAIISLEAVAVLDKLVSGEYEKATRAAGWRKMGMICHFFGMRSSNHTWIERAMTAFRRQSRLLELPRDQAAAALPRYFLGIEARYLGQFEGIQGRVVGKPAKCFKNF